MIIVMMIPDGNIVIAIVLMFFLLCHVLYCIVSYF